ncbi:MAG TPA: MFS transporter [Thermoleophilaceae bacterium]
MLRRLLTSLSPDVRPFRDSRDYRLLTLGALITGLGTQASLVALPYQVYVTTHEPVLVGLLGLVELGPLVAASLFGGALADRYDRRRLLLIYQLLLVAVAGALAAVSFLGTPGIGILYVLAGALAGAGQLERVARAAIVPNVVRREYMRPAISNMFGLMQLTMVVGPGVGGLLIAAFDVQAAYTVDAASCLGMALAAAAMSPQPPHGAHHDPVLRSIADGLRFVKGQQALIGSFAIDLLAMTFGMPRALFAVMSVTLYHAGAAGTGALYAAVSAGATIAALTTGWLSHARYLGRIVIGAVTVWGAAIAAAGLMPSLALAALLLAIAGAADSVSAVCRSTISQSLTPDHMRGRMSSVFSLVVAGGPRLGDVESGTVASLTSTRVSVTSGGIACLAGVALIVVAFPEFAGYDGDAVEAAAAAAAA